MAHKKPEVVTQSHSAAWIFQVWASFVIALGMLFTGVYHLPVDLWTKGFMFMGTVFVVGSSFSLAKTLRDNHEADKVITRLDDARVSRYLAEHDPLENPL